MHVLLRQERSYEFNNELWVVCILPATGGVDMPIHVLVVVNVSLANVSTFLLGAVCTTQKAP